MDKTKKRVREHAAKHGMSYQAAWNQLEGARAGRPDEALEFWEWMAHVDGPARSRCLTIADVTGMRAGETVELLVMDRNLCDHVYPGPGRPLRPPAFAEDFFSLAVDGATYAHVDGISGRLRWGWEEADAWEDFTFEVEYSPGHWHPLVDGRLPTREWFHEQFEISEAGLDEMLAERCPGMVLGMPWRDLPPETRVGWRGPAMVWRRLSEMPPVFARIDLERLMLEGVMPTVRAALRMDGERRMWLKHTPDGWQLAVEGLTERERETMGRMFADVTVVAGRDRLFLSDGDRERAFRHLHGLVADAAGLRTVARMIREETDSLLLEHRLGLPGRRDMLLHTFRRITEESGITREAVEGVLERMEWPEGFEPLTGDDVFGV